MFCSVLLVCLVATFVGLLMFKAIIPQATIIPIVNVTKAKDFSADITLIKPQKAVVAQ